MLKEVAKDSKENIRIFNLLFEQEELIVNKNNHE